MVETSASPGCSARAHGGMAGSYDIPEQTIHLSITASRVRENLRVEIDGTALVLLKAEGRFFAFQDFCTHRFGPLSEGSCKGYEIECPWHRSCFDMRTGKVSRGPAKEGLKTFEVDLRDGIAWIAMPRKTAARMSQPNPNTDLGGGPSKEHH